MSQPPSKSRPQYLETEKKAGALLYHQHVSNVARLKITPLRRRYYRPVLLISTETLLEFWLAMARSGLPSRLKSPTAMDQAKLPAAKLHGAWKLPSPLTK